MFLTHQNNNLLVATSIAQPHDLLFSLEQDNEHVPADILRLNINLKGNMHRLYAV